jgi:hypothetical protein
MAVVCSPRVPGVFLDAAGRTTDPARQLDFSCYPLRYSRKKEIRGTTTVEAVSSAAVKSAGKSSFTPPPNF